MAASPGGVGSYEASWAPGQAPRSGSCSWGSATADGRRAPRGRARTSGCKVTPALRPAEAEARQVRREHRTPGCAHAPSPRPTQPVTSSLGCIHPEPVGAGRGRQAGPRAADRRTDCGRQRAPRPATKGRRPPQRSSPAAVAGKCVCADPTRTTTPGRLCATISADSISQKASGPPELALTSQPRRAAQPSGKCSFGAGNRPHRPRSTHRPPDLLSKYLGYTCACVNV